MQLMRDRILKHTPMRIWDYTRTTLEMLDYTPAEIRRLAHSPVKIGLEQIIAEYDRSQELVTEYKRYKDWHYLAVEPKRRVRCIVKGKARDHLSKGNSCLLNGLLLPGTATAGLVRRELAVVGYCADYIEEFMSIKCDFFHKYRVMYTLTTRKNTWLHAEPNTI